MKLKAVAGAACIALAVASTSHAATFKYSYTFGSGDQITGTVDGILEADGNTVAVTSFGQPLLNGISFSATLQEVPFSPLIFVLDGVGLDLFFRAASGNVHLELIENLSFGATVRDAPIILGEGLDLARWDASALSPIPLPAGGLLMLSGIGGLVAFGRRKKRAAKHNSV